MNPATRLQGDLNDDGTVSGFDYTEVITYWDAGTPPPPEAPSEPVATSGVSSDQIVSKPASSVDNQNYPTAAASWLYHRSRGQRNAKGIHARSRFEPTASGRTDRLVPTMQMPIQLSSEDEPLDILNLLQFKLPLDV